LIDAVQQPEFVGASSSIWFPAALKEPLMFEGLLLIGVRGFKIFSEDPALNNKAMMYKNRLIRMVNEAIRDKEKATSDGTIAALLCLSYDEVRIFAHTSHLMNTNS
jgi:hypothetical protein